MRLPTGVTPLRYAALRHTRRFSSVIVKVSDQILAIPYQDNRLSGNLFIDYPFGLAQDRFTIDD